MFSGHSSSLLHLCHLLDASCLEVCVSYKTSSIVIQLVECYQDGELCIRDKAMHTNAPASILTHAISINVDTNVMTNTHVN